MPRKYVSIKKCKKYDPEVIEKALIEVQNGGSFRKVAQKYEIDHTVLYRHLKRGTTKKKGGQTALSETDENLLVNRLQICSDWGYPIDAITLRLLIKDYIDKQGKTVPKFKNNLPGPDFVCSFLKRHKEELSARMCQNIKRSRAAIGEETINKYFDHLEKELKDVPACNIINYDETNLCDDPGRKVVIARRGCKYPERVMNSTKASVSVMFAATGDGTILPPYIVYKAQHMYESWRVGGPANSRYNRTKSGWFDAFCFQDWVESIAIPHLSKLDGVKILLGDNLASHLNVDVIKICLDHNIKFVFLPTNSTHLTQPLDVAFFHPLKQSWRSILLKWKQGPGRAETTVPKDRFPPLLKELFVTLKEKNVVSGFKKCGIIPLNRDQVLGMLPSSKGSQKSVVNEAAADALDSSFKEYMESIRQSDKPIARKKRTKVTVLPGKSVAVADFLTEDSTGTDKNECTTGPSSSSKEPQNTPKRKKNVKDDDESTTTEESDFSLQDSDAEWRESFSEEEQPESDHATLKGNDFSKFSLGDFALIKVQTGNTKHAFRLYVVKVIEFDEEGYIGKFYKKSSHSFKFLETDEEALFKTPEDVVRKLGKPTLCTTGRFQGHIIFNDDFDGLTIN